MEPQNEGLEDFKRGDFQIPYYFLGGVLITTETMYKGNPSKSPYMCIKFDPLKKCLIQ